MENLEDIGFNELHLNDASIEVLWDYIHQLQRHIRKIGFSDPEYSPNLDEMYGIQNIRLELWLV